MPETKRKVGLRSRIFAALLAGVASIWSLRLVMAWADRTVAFVTLAAFIAAFVLLVDWLVAGFGPGLWRFARSVGISVGHAVRDDDEVRALRARHPRFFGWVGRRFSRERPSGLYLSVTVASALYFFSSFASVALSLAMSRALTNYDPRILALLRAFRTPILTRLLWIATVLADPRVIVLLAVAVALMLTLWGRRAEAALLVITLSGGTILQTFAKLAFHRPRPPAALALIQQPSSFSFPSGHAFASMLLAGVVVFVLWRMLVSLRERLAILFAAGFVVVFVGLSRVYLGVHWPTDVIASWWLALGWLCVTCGGYLMLARFRGIREIWPTWSSLRTRRAILLIVLIAAIVGVGVGAQADPLLAEATAQTPVRPWTVSLGPDGLPAPTADDLLQLPRFSENLDGSPQTPIGIVFVGSRTELTSAFEAAGWLVAEKPSLSTLTKSALAAVGNRPYPTAPVTPAFLGGGVQDIAFEKSAGAATVRRRHHARFWQTHVTLDGVPVWVATASFDSRLEIGSTIPLPTHHIDPNIDAEQTYVVDDLTKGGKVVLIARTSVTQPTTGTNAQGDPWFTQGLASVLEAKP